MPCHVLADLIENKITASIIEAAIEVHRVLGGPGLLECIYEDALVHELKIRNIPVQQCWNNLFFNFVLFLPNHSLGNRFISPTIAAIGLIGRIGQFVKTELLAI